MAGVTPDHACMIRGVDLAAADHRDFAGATVHGHQSHPVVMLIVIGQFLVRVFQLHVPSEDFLALGGLGRQPQALERVDDRFGEAVAGGVADLEAHQARNL